MRVHVPLQTLACSAGWQCTCQNSNVSAPQVRDPSLLRFLVDMRDADLDDRQLRDDLMTMLIAGHETTAAVRAACPQPVRKLRGRPIKQVGVCVYRWA